MLPSTGYFKAVICPFFDSGSCDRPYCHFRHVKKEYNTTSSPVVESGTMFQKLVSEAVQKALKQTDTPSPSTCTQLTDDTLEEMSVVTHVQTTPKATYNPTPISELNKIHNVDSEDIEDAIEQRRKHIPVPYTPRKPGAASVKRSVDANDSSKSLLYVPAPVTYTPGCTEPVLLDPYTPKGSTESNEKYLPGSGIELQEYTPKETPLSTKRNYIPSDKNSSKKKILEYKPVKISPRIEKSVVTYKPTLKYLAPCFSSDEDEPDTKKTKLSSDLNGLDDLGPEFDILDQILDEEKNEERDVETSTNAVTKEKPKEKKSNNKESKKKSYDHSKKDKDATNKSENRKSHDKIKPDNKEKQSSNAKVKKESKTSDKKPHKRSSKDKERKHEQTTDIKKQSTTKTTDKSSKHPEHRSSKISSSSSSKSDPKRKDKSYKRSKESNNKHKKRKAEDTIHNDLYDNNNTHSDDGELAQNNEELYEMSESDEETIALECKRIFEEYIPQEKATKYLENMVNTPLEDIPEKEYVSSKKRISRTMGKDIKIMPKAQAKPNFKVSAAQTMAERLIKVREYHTSKTASSSINSDDVVPKADLSKSTSTTPNTGNSKIRIAHVPYASTLMSVKKTIKPNPILKKDEPSTSSTVIQTIKKGTQRVAHLPNEKFIDRPSVLEPLASKIPINIRSTYLNMMIDECLKIYLSAVDAYARAQHEELATSKKCSTVPIYKNSAVLTVSRLRRELQDCNGIKKSGAECAALQNIPQVISGKSNYSGSWSIENKNRRVLDNAREFNGAKLYNNIRKWILTEQQLQDNGFPRPHSSGEKGRAMIYSQNKQKPPKGVIRTCCRCKKDYIIDKKGFPAVKAECIYHPNNKYRVRGEAKYQCCSQDATSDGCCIAPCHVYEYVDYENLKGYVRTLPPGSVLDDYGVYSLDCEMCYTTQGLDLTRITVIDSSCKVVYETLVRPLHPIIDYNTRYSGITEEQMVEVKTTLLEVQATLLTMFSSKTILIGHSLESDCKALKLIHDTVIDTSVLFPHKMGPPYKRALRNLSSEYLKKIIQNSVDGHDSAEDATVCMELIIYKLKEDLKTR